MRLLLALTFSILLLHSNAQQGGETCATATLIEAIPYVAVGTTTGATDDYFESCWDYPNAQGAAEVVYAFTTGAEERYIDLTLCEAITDYDSQLYVYEENCDSEPVGCQEDGCTSPDYGAPYNSRITAQYLAPNTTYYFVVDGFSADSDGNYQLVISDSEGLDPPQATNLPLVILNTDGQEIVDEPKININMKIIDNGPFEDNHLSDPANGYDGVVGIEFRGSFSATLPQKPYGLETRDALGENNNVGLFGMPAENDWILLANYNDKTFLRNVLAFDLSTKMGHYAPRTELCEVVLNDIYQGVYVFTEKIKRDNGRIDLPRLDLDDNAGDSLTGGYVFKVDYWNWNDSWESDYENPNYAGDAVRYVHAYPEEDVITNEQQSYIQNRVSDFEDALWGNEFSDPSEGYRKYIDTRSFIDYFLVNEFSRNVDGFKKSRFFHKDKDSVDSLIYAGPVWDFDWGFKDVDDNELNGAGWRHSFSGGTDVIPPGWYIRLLQDSTFANEVACRYEDLRSTVLHKDSLFNYIDDMGAYVDAAQERHFTRWPILGENVGTPEIGAQAESYAEELVNFKSWISDRLDWLDANMPGLCSGVGIVENQKKAPYWTVYPNPSLGSMQVYANQQIAQLEVFDLLGKRVAIIDDPDTLSTLDTTDWSGSYIVRLTFEDGRVVQQTCISH